MNYEFNLLHYVGVVPKIVRATAVETAEKAEMAAQEGDYNTPSGPTGPTGRGVKTVVIMQN